MPVGIRCVERASDIHDIDPETVQDFILRLRELLDHVIHTVVTGGDPEMPFQIAIRDGGNPGARRGAEIHGDAVGLLVSNRGKDSLSGGHDEWC
jgi:hypothetical protein